MSVADHFTAPGERGEAAVPFSERGPASIEGVASFGFWLFLLSDVVMFSGLFAAYAVLANHTAGGPDGARDRAPLAAADLPVGRRHLRSRRRLPRPRAQ